MPELPEVETVRRGLQPVLESSVIEEVRLNRSDLRFPLPDNMASQLKGATVTSVGRRAKYLLMSTDRTPALVCHLGMSGSFRIEQEGETVTPGVFHHERFASQKHDHVVFQVRRNDGERFRIVFNDPRRFGFMLFADSARGSVMLEGLGIEPTGNALSGEVLANLFARKAAPLKAALLDQSLIAGLGNIYVSEALWRSRLSPRRAAGTIAARSGKVTKRSEILAESVRDVIADAIAAGGSSLRDYIHVDGSLGYFQHCFSVYGREGEPCPRMTCSGFIKRIVQSGRSTFYCPVCQK